MGSERFRYEGYDVDPATGHLECRYSVGQWRFTEEISFELPEGRHVGGHRGGAGGSGDTHAAVGEAARIVALLAGVSYYKTAAPPVVDLGDIATTPAERAFLRMVLVEGLGEFAHRNGLDLSGLVVSGPDRAGGGPVTWQRTAGRPLVPFGAGIDSIVTVEEVRRTHPGLTLFVVGRGGERFDAIERTVDVTGLPVARAERRLDPSVLEWRRSGFLNGHVPVTGILSAVAVMAAVLGGFDAVVMSNERSASAATMEVDGRAVNHQWSKGMAFEAGLREVLAGVLAPPPDYFSFLRGRSELWVARTFAALERYHGVFRSCNKAFFTDPALRLDHWCGTCDKCCFIDLVLAPFLGPDVLARIFDGREPLATPSLEPSFQALLGIGPHRRPFECVGDAHECRAAAELAAARPDRASSAMLQGLAAQARAAGGGATSEAGRLFVREGPDFVPASYCTKEPDAGEEATAVPGAALPGPAGRG